MRWGNRGALAGTSDLIDDTQLHGLPSFRLRRQQSWSGIGQAGDAELQRLREQLQEERESGALSSAVQARLPQQPWNPCFGLCAMHMWHRARKRGAGKLRGRQPKHPDRFLTKPFFLRPRRQHQSTPPVQRSCCKTRPSEGSGCLWCKASETVCSLGESVGLGRSNSSAQNSTSQTPCVQPAVRATSASSMPVHRDHTVRAGERERDRETRDEGVRRSHFRLRSEVRSCQQQIHEERPGPQQADCREGLFYSSCILHYKPRSVASDLREQLQAQQATSLREACRITASSVCTGST